LAKDLIYNKSVCLSPALWGCILGPLELLLWSKEEEEEANWQRKLFTPI